MKIIGENLKKIREEYGWSQEEIAELLEVNPSAWASYEAGNTFMNLNTLIKLSSIVHRSVDEILGLEDKYADRNIKKILDLDTTLVKEELLAFYRIHNLLARTNCTKCKGLTSCDECKINCNELESISVIMDLLYDTELKLEKAKLDIDKLEQECERLDKEAQQYFEMNYEALEGMELIDAMEFFGI